jgi:RNA-directed DNA polymerase
MSDDEKREPSINAAESKTPCMRGRFMRGNRETPESPSTDGGEGRSEKATGRTSDTHDPGESDGPIVPRKRANKAGRPAAESVEGSGSTKGNVSQAAAYRTQSRASVSIGLAGVREAARRDQDVRFTALLHHITPALLEASFYELKRSASPGVDGVTWRAYADGLTDRIADLHGRVHRGAYRAKPSKRAWISKPDGRQRPLGIAALEDKIVQQATKTVLDQIYEEDFLGFSYGFRPGRGAHDALDAWSVGLERRKVNWVLDADIRGFFDTIDHGWLLRFLEHRIADHRVLRLIRKWLRAGVSEDGTWSKTEVGTAQGAVISPLLANVYLHYVFDLWVDQWRRRHARGDVIVVRYADDVVMGFQHRSEAERFLHELRARFEQFGLSLHPEKTRLIEFGRFAAERRNRRGAGRPETFDFLGFTHYGGRTRKGDFAIKRKSASKRLRATLRAIKVQLQRRMHAPVAEQGQWLRRVMQGWYNYHAVPGNGRCLSQFRTAVGRLWQHVLRRRSQKARPSLWKWVARLIQRWFPATRILHPYPNERFAVMHPR